MEKRLRIFMIIFAVSLLVFVISYYGYYMYIGFMWVLNDRMLMLLVSDGLFILFLPLAIVLLLRLRSAWWLTMILFTQLFVAKIIAIFANLFLVFSGTIAEPLQWSGYVLELIFIFVYLLIIIVFAMPSIRDFFTITLTPKQWVWRVFAGAMLLYILHFLITMGTVYFVNPQAP
ncbi:hypothetical protein CR203_09135 [Salipaludibacillus neizhouensis]|uniref:Uncharacterized protein n=1 Tax=Salipaludibacillus neizhouensis TaxID=885475 RepID=A0A3A9K2Z9_9BACI|nr:hypothetical protein [Salipaludibacillus neizhouensis]RKL67504.1 hypothetical protein CR203_09135 [Salipaludibacillus neizhouensis]